MAVVRILGVDPGTVIAGWACVEVRERDAVRAAPSTLLADDVANLVRRGASGGPARLIDAGALELGRRSPVAHRLAALADGIRAVIAATAAHELALEEAFGGKSLQSALRIGEARGVVLAMAVGAGLDVHQYPPARIKRSVAGNGAASKEAVARMAMQALGLTSLDGPADVADALAVALCRLEERRAPQLPTRAGRVGG